MYDTDPVITASGNDAKSETLARHRKEYPKLHDKLGRIEVMLKREMDAPEFDREKVKQEIMSIADPENLRLCAANRRLRFWQKKRRNGSSARKQKRLNERPLPNVPISGISLTVL